MAENTNKPYGIVLNKDELATAIVLELKLKCNELSWFTGYGEDDRVALSEEALGLLKNEKFIKAAGIITQPDLRINALKGGSTFGIEALGIYRKGNFYAAILKSIDILMLLIFENETSLVEWWSETFAAKIETEDSLANFLPEPLKIEEFIVMLHLIDSYKRAHMESMLLYKPVKDYMIELEEFISSLNVSVSSGDIRWLLPSFFALTPGLSGLKLSVKPALLENARQMGFISALEQPDKAKLQMVFLDKGVTMGYEFANTWMYGLGWDASVIKYGSVVTIAHKFLAPTSFANHLFTAGKDSSGSYNVSHLALTFEEFKQSLHMWLSEIS